MLAYISKFVAFFLEKLDHFKNKFDTAVPLLDSCDSLRDKIERLLGEGVNMDDVRLETSENHAEFDRSEFDLRFKISGLKHA